MFVTFLLEHKIKITNSLSLFKNMLLIHTLAECFPEKELAEVIYVVFIKVKSIKKQITFVIEIYILSHNSAGFQLKPHIFSYLLI